MAIIDDFRIERNIKPQKEESHDNTVWCSRVGEKISGPQCACFTAGNHYYNTGTCPIGPDGRSFQTDIK